MVVQKCSAQWKVLLVDMMRRREAPNENEPQPQWYIECCNRVEGNPTYVQWTRWPHHMGKQDDHLFLIH